MFHTFEQGGLVEPASADWIMPMSTVVCEPLFRSRVLRKMVGYKDVSLVIHPATLVRLRTRELPTELKSHHRDGLRLLSKLIESRSLPVLSHKAFPDTASIRDKSIQNTISGGKGFELEWTYGLLHWDDEWCKRVTSIAILADRDRQSTCWRQLDCSRRLAGQRVGVECSSDASSLICRR